MSLNRAKKFSTLYPPWRGASFVQDGRHFDAQGEQVDVAPDLDDAEHAAMMAGAQPPIAPAPPPPPLDPEAQARRDAADAEDARAEAAELEELARIEADRVAQAAAEAAAAPQPEPEPVPTQAPAPKRTVIGKV